MSYILILNVCMHTKLIAVGKILFSNLKNSIYFVLL